MSVEVAVITATTHDVDALVAEAIGALRLQRGGPALLDDARDLFEAADDRALLDRLVSVGGLVGVYAHDALVGFAAVTRGSTGTILGTYVRPGHRRQLYAQKLITTLTTGEWSLRNAWALPGDRATKSLYEKAGWKARRLTMSVE